MSIIKVDYGEIGGGTLEYNQYTQSEGETKTYNITNGVVNVRGSGSYTQRMLLSLYIKDGNCTEITKNTTATYSYSNGVLTCSFSATWSSYLIDLFTID